MSLQRRQFTKLSVNLGKNSTEIDRKKGRELRQGRRILGGVNINKANFMLRKHIIYDFVRTFAK